MFTFGGRSKVFSNVFKIWRGCKLELACWQSTLTRINHTHKKTSFIYLRKSEKYISTMISAEEKPINFRFSDYDCIGFDLDNTLARYKVGPMIEMEYEVMANYLVEKKGYSKKHLLKPFDHNFILRGLIVDDENGNIVRIAQDGYILQAAHGTKMLKDDEIEYYYPQRHWEPADKFVQDPLATWNGPYSERMRTLLDYFDIASSLVFARAIDAVDEEKGQKQEKYYVWPDLQESLQNMFNRENFQTGKGVYFERMKANPEKYYYKCSQQLLNWLKNLKGHGKMLFLITGSHVDFASHTALNTLGPNWRDYFDIVVCFSKKPGFFTMNRDFIRLEGDKECGPIPSNELEIGGIYTHGNWRDLQKFLTKHIPKNNPRFLYVGDNLIQDIYTPNFYSHCDTVTVCEELEAEGIQGYQQFHPDQHFLASSLWGSYFKCNNFSTNWEFLMKKHSKLWVPSLEYVASLPLDYEFHVNEFH